MFRLVQIRNRKLMTFMVGSLLIGATALFGGCSGDDGKNGAAGANGSIFSSLIDFTAILPAVTDTEKNTIRSTDTLTIAGVDQSIGYTTLMTTGDRNNSEIYGALKDYADTPILNSDNSPRLCNGTDPDLTDAIGIPIGSGLDHVSFLEKNNKIYMVSQFECEVGAMYMNELSQDASGNLSVTPNTLQFVSEKSEFGGFVHCAGQTTPWQSHLGSEEYEPDAKSVELTADPITGVTGNKYFDALGEYWGGDMKLASPYYYGWSPEVAVDGSGNPVYSKHYAMGRLSHELAYVMPDQKTVYMSDDGTNGTLFMFVADTAADLSAGQLYAAKWNQVSGTGLGQAVLTWVDMGHATDAAVRDLIDPDGNVNTNDGIVFSDIFETEVPQVDGTCATAGFVNVNTATGNECLQLKDVNGDTTIDATDAALAGRLEARRMAAYLGATSEFRKMEGITYNARDSKLYLAMSQVAKGMQAGTSYDLGGPDHIQVEQNDCGGVYELDMSPNATIGSSYVAYGMKGLLAGTPVDYTGTALAGNTCDIDGLANPDNLTFLTDTNILVIGEDTDSHINDAVWAYDVSTRNLTRIASTPYGSETTSPFWYKNLNNSGFGYLTLTTQHPFGEVSKTYVRPAGVDPMTQTGYLGPFDFSKVK